MLEACDFNAIPKIILGSAIVPAFPQFIKKSFLSISRFSLLIYFAIFNKLSISTAYVFILLTLKAFIKRVFEIRFIRYLFVGSAGFVLDIGITYILRDGLGMNGYFASVSGVSVALLNNFILNKYWTFEDKNSEIWSQLLRYLFVSAIGLAANAILLWSFYEMLFFNFYLSKILAIITVVFWNFFVNKAITFSNRYVM